MIAGGGGKSPITKKLEAQFNEHSWAKKNFDYRLIVDGESRKSRSHEIDHFRAVPRLPGIALEIEWNNKDPFFDRDLENFQRLHAQGIISAGIIVTRGSDLQATMTARIEDFLRRSGIEDEAPLTALGMKDRTARQRDFVTRAMASGADFAAAFARFFVSDKFGPATTHWAKLADRIHRGVGNPCPLLLIGLPSTAISGDPLPESPSAPSLFDE